MSTSTTNNAGYAPLCDNNWYVAPHVQFATGIGGRDLDTGVLEALAQWLAKDWVFLVWNGISRACGADAVKTHLLPRFPSLPFGQR